MALDKLVDSTQLDNNLTSVANAIRAKSGGTSQLAFPAGFVSEIGNIPGGGGITPTGTKEITITENGTTTEDVTNYASAQITVNVPSSGGSGVLSGSFTPESNSLTVTITVDRTVTGLAIKASSANPYGSGVRVVSAILMTDTALAPISAVTSNSSGSASAGGWNNSGITITQSGNTITVQSTNGAGGGYFIGGITYGWWAW